MASRTLTAALGRRLSSLSMAEQRIILASCNGVAPSVPEVEHPIAAEATVLPTSQAARPSGADAAIGGGKVRWRHFLF